MKISIIDKEFEQKVDQMETTIKQLDAKFAEQQDALKQLEKTQSLFEQALNKLVEKEDLDPAIHKVNNNLKSLRKDITDAEKEAIDYVYNLADEQDIDLDAIKNKSVDALHSIADAVESLPEKRAS
ncbi:MAG: hypothetical protein AseanaTS_04560 [Candidatus Pelagadaptatus aseana]|uniref:hypothetical protein n=1 Tax=Candidatus Pelagadaptatus aseana TaxID=3120508 RepID=UPI0039B25106